MQDLYTVARKELLELWKARGSLRAQLLSIIPVLVVFGIYLPWQQGELWVQNPIISGIWFIMLPLILAGGTAADSFAGERERHTLETLLASRLSDRDILLGKVVATVVYATGMVWVCALLGLVTVNVSAGSGSFLNYGAAASILIIVGSGLISCCIASIGALVSLHATSVRAATQAVSLFSMVLFLGGPLLLQVLPASARAAVGEALVTADSTLLSLGASAVLAAVDLVLLLVGLSRFQRVRLIVG
jgi:ABC-2 type transport system permease protein